MGITDVKNPFVVGRYLSKEFFCDREEETAFLRKQIENGRNVALISERRIGKSGLIEHFFHQPDILENYHVFFIDIYSTTSLSELVYTMGKEIYEQLKPKATQWKEKFFQVITSFRVGFKLDSFSGTPTFDLGLGDIQTPQTTLDEIFQYIEESDKPCIIAIDEFQQIGEYAEKNVEALLRTKIQHCHHAQFIFSGSKRHMMTNMFNSPSKPFYQSAITMGLQPIPADTYCAFAVGLFEARNRHIIPDTVNTVWQQYQGYTWFVQMMMNELFALTDPSATCTSDMLQQARNNIVMAQEAAYKDLMSLLPPKQKMVLQAIAKEGNAKGITSSQFIKKYSLNSASTVQSAVKQLLKNDLVTVSDNVYRVSDFFFTQWLSTVY